MAALGVLVTPRGAWAADDRCDGDGLAKAEVSTSVRLEHDDRTFTKVVTELTVDAPGTWSLAHDLLLSEDSRLYIRAMSCLLGSELDEQRWAEWWTSRPSVTSQGGRIRVVYKAYGWVDDHSGYTQVGIWRVMPDTLRKWTVTLATPSALSGAWWDEITVDPGGPGAERAEPQPRAGEGTAALVWRPGRVAEGSKELGISVTIRPSWQRSWAAWGGHPLAAGLDLLGSILWPTAVSLPLLLAVRRYRRRYWVPTASQQSTLTNLKAWAVVAVPVYALAAGGTLAEQLMALSGQFEGFEHQLTVEYGCTLLSVVVLLAFARPPAWVVNTTFLVAQLPCVLVLMALRGQEPTYGIPYVWLRPLPVEGRVALYGLASFCLTALLLLAFVAVAWRIADDGRLLPKSRRFPGSDRKLRMRIAAPAVLAATVLIILGYGLVEEYNWQRATWLTDPLDDDYGEEHREDFEWMAMWFVSFVNDWAVYNFGWLLTALAVLAVLRTWRDASALSPLDDRADRLALLVFFPVAVGLDVQDHLDTPLLDFLWVPLYASALYGATRLLAHRSVLAQSFEGSSRRLSAVTGPSARQTLLGKARSYREIHAELRRLDQGLFGDVPPERARLERDLTRLHKWTLNQPPGATTDRLPAHVSVVDMALALGPRDDWWGNGTRAARLAMAPGVPAAAFNTWAQWIRGEGWHNTLTDLLGLPGLVATFVGWTVVFAAAGFVLGALWRVLPGRRGAVKALPVAAAFALPVGLDALVSWFTRESSANLALYIAMMLFVLTVTAIALDFDTFGSERRYWQSRLGLLLSVYQMRYYSLQVAYLIGQMIAIITIWQFFAEPDAVPYQGDEPPSDGNGS